MKKIDLPIVWSGEAVGLLKNPQVDGFHVYGEWVRDKTPTTERLRAALEREEEVEVELGGGPEKLVGYADMGSDGKLDITMRVETSG